MVTGRMHSYHNDYSDSIENPGKLLTLRQQTRGSSKSTNLASITDRIQTLLKLIEPNVRRPGIHWRSHMEQAGLHYTGTGDKAICSSCPFEKEGWKNDDDPFTLHRTNYPDCPFVVGKLSSFNINIQPRSSEASNCSYTTSHSYKQNTIGGGIEDPEISYTDGPNKRQKLENKEERETFLSLNEVKSLENCRRRSFTVWPHRSFPTAAQMIEAGFFNCNVGDRVICIYCNLICQQWSSDSISDPWVVHQTLSPKCIFVKSKLSHSLTTVPPIVNENPSEPLKNDIPNTGIVHAVGVNPIFADLPRREASFRNWKSDTSPPVEKLVKAGFFYSGTSNIVTCFYCNGSLQNWGPNDEPKIEHARWFPNCAYAKQLCGSELYRKIQISKQLHLERATARGNSNRDVVNGSGIGNLGQLVIPDESSLSRFVAARLDLPVSQDLLGKSFKLSIIKRCWEDQLRIKRDDFQCDVDLHMACIILKKQIDHIDGQRDKIIIPSVKMKQLLEERVREMQAQSDLQTPSETTTDATSSTGSISEQSSSNNGSVQQSNNQNQTKIQNSQNSNSMNEPTINNACVICLQEEKGLACIPCGHLVACVPCGHSLKSCPICRREIQAFVRIYT